MSLLFKSMLAQVVPGLMHCVKENLPAHKTEKEMNDFLENRVASGVMNLRKWLCPHCKHWHHTGVAYGPSGASDGNSRAHKHYEELKKEEKRRKTKL